MYLNSPLTSYVYGSREYQEQLYLAVMNSGGNALPGLIRRLFFFDPAPIVSFLMYSKGTIADGYGRIGRVMSAYNDDEIYSI